MHLKKVTNKYKGETREYAQIVQSVQREDGQITQETIRSLGRMESEEDWEWARSVLEAMKKGEKLVRLKRLEIDRQLELGGIWVSDEIWRRYGIQKALMNSFSGRNHDFNLERIAFLLAVNRFYDPSSDLSALEWINERAYSQTGAKKDWIYDTLKVLVEEKEKVERKILENLKSKLGPSLDLVFYDLTSTYFEGVGPELAEFGYSRDGRPDRVQIVLGIVMADGIPIAHQIWPGNTADKSTLEEAVEDLKERFDIRNVIFVADRGVISSNNLEELKDEGYEYILSTKRRKENLVEDLLVKDVPGDGKIRTEEVHSENDRRYILCLNEERREKDLERLKEGREKCEKELWKLRDRYEESQEGRGRPMTEKGVMKRAEKTISGYKRIFNVNFDETLTWGLKDKEWEYERKIAGKFLLVTTSDLKPDRTMEAYKELKDVERAFHQLKNLLDLRPVYHSTDKGVRGHVSVCILALLLIRLMEKKAGTTFGKIMEELKQIKVNVLEVEDEEVYQRNRINESQGGIFEALDVKEPPKFLTKL